MMSDVVWDEVMHYVDPEMDIGSYARASNPVCLGSEALGSRNLGSEVLGKALDEDLGKALGNRNPNSKALGNGRSGSGYCNRVQRVAT